MFRFREWARLARANSAVSLLVAAAAGALVLNIAAGFLVYSNTQRLIRSAEWVEHTQEVLATLQRVSVLVERIDYRSRLYLATGNEEQRARVLASANQLETMVVRLKSQVEDNSGQQANVQMMMACSTQLSHAAENLSLKSQLPEAVTQHCQQTIGLMVDSEQWLLKDRSKGSQRSSFLSISVQIVLMVLFGLMLLTLFALLLRDAVHRQRLGQTMALANERLETSVQTLQERATETALLTASRDELQLCTNLNEVYQSAVNSFSRLLAGTSGSLCMINNSRQLVEVVASWQGSSGASKVEEAFLPEACCGLRLGQRRWRRPEVSSIHCGHFAEAEAERYLCQPIAAHGNTLGVLYVQCSSDVEMEMVNSRMDGVRQLVQLTGMAIATLNLRMKLENQSIRDALTGLFNRHFMQVSLDRELARAARRKLTLAVFMLDLDHFKKFNDTYGHAVGDLALRTVSEIFKANIRTEDIACRYGGEEFTIILPDIAMSIAMERAESIRRAVEALKLPVEGQVLNSFSISIGVAMYPADGEQGDQLLRHADMALYRAKHQGRNCVEQHQPTLVAG